MCVLLAGGPRAEAATMLRSASLVQGAHTRAKESFQQMDLCPFPMEILWLNDHVPSGRPLA